MSNKEIYGIRCSADDDEDRFELQFRCLGEKEKNKIKQLIKSNNNDSKVYQVLIAFSTSNNIFCPNWDENRCFKWVDTELSFIKELLET
jgi:hypothetical protein